MHQEDEAILSMSTSASNKTQAAAAPAQSKVGGRRSLEKTSWLQDSGATSAKIAALEDLEDDNSHQPFD